MTRRKLFNRDELARAIRVSIAERGIADKVAAAEIGIATSGLSRIAHGGKKPDVESYLRITRWLRSAPDATSPAQDAGTRGDA